MFPRHLWGLPIALTLLACDNGTSSDPPRESASISVDEKSRIITMHLQQSENACVIEDNGKLTWKTLTTEEIDRYFQYDFMGDSLAFFWCDTPYCSDDDLNGEILVGGKAGQLYGTWNSTPCLVLNGSTFCESDPIPGSYSYTFTRDSFESRQDSDEDGEDETPFKLTHSMYMANLLRVLNGDSRYQGIGSLFDDGEDEVEHIINSNKNVVQFRSGSAMDVRIQGKAYSIKLNDLSGTELYQFSVSLSVGSGNTTCTLQHENSEDITRSMCNEGNRNYLNFIEADNVQIADTYSKSNENEFVKCLKKITGNNDISYGFFAAKKSNRTMPGSLPRRLSR